MRHKWVNLILLTLVAGELVTGAVGLMSGNSQHEIVLQIHSVLGYSIIAVLAWKTALGLAFAQTTVARKATQRCSSRFSAPIDDVEHRCCLEHWWILER